MNIVCIITHKKAGRKRPEILSSKMPEKITGGAGYSFILSSF